MSIIEESVGLIRDDRLYSDLEESAINACVFEDIKSEVAAQRSSFLSRCDDQRKSIWVVRQH